MYFINDWNVMSHRNNDKTFLFAAMTKYFISCFVQIFWFHVHIFYHILATATAAAEKPHLINLVIQRMFYVRPSIVKVTFSLLSLLCPLSLFFLVEFTLGNISKMLRSKKFIKKSGEKNFKKFQACYIRMFTFITLRINVSSFRNSINSIHKN